MNRLCRRRICLGGLPVAFLIALSGCAQSPSAIHAQDDQYSQGIKSLDTLTQLEMIAEREAIKPSAVRRDLVNRIMDGQVPEFSVGSGPYRKAYRSLDGVLDDALDGASGDAFEGFESSTVSANPLLPQVAKMYARGRSAMINNRLDEAISIFGQLHEVSPGSPGILVGLGDAQMKAGNRSEATRAYLKAVELGSRDERVLVYGAMGLSDDPSRVIQLCGYIWRRDLNGANGGGNENGGRVLAGVMLAKALINTGSFAAGAQALERALEMLESGAVRDPRFRRELIELYTKRAEQHAYLGDAWLAIDQPQRAAVQYELSGSMVDREPHVLTARRIAADLLAGHSAEGSLKLFEAIEAFPGNDSPALHTIVQALGDHPVVGELVYDWLVEWMQDDQRTVAQRRSLLGLLLSMTDQALQRVWLLVHADPGIVSPVACARALELADGFDEQVELMRTIVDQSPSIGPVVVASAVRSTGRPLDAIETALGDDEASELLRCLLAVELERPDLIDTQLDNINLKTIGGKTSNNKTIDNRSTTWLIAHGRAAALDGRWELSKALLEACLLREPRMDDADRGFFVDTLVIANHSERAVDLASQRAGRGDASSADLLLQAKLANMLGDPVVALDALDRAVLLDPYDESIYEKLIALRSPMGVMPDEKILRELAQQLNQRLPDTALIKLVMAYELASGNNANNSGNGGRNEGISRILQSERVLIEAHRQHPNREIGIDLLLSLWRTLAGAGDLNAVDRGIDWLGEKFSQMPGSIDLAGGYARMLVFDKRASEAEAFLADFYDRYPSRAVGQLHEGLIRSNPDRRSEADLLALKRLEGLVSISSCLERLERAAASGRLAEYTPELLVPVDSAGSSGSAGSVDWSWTLRQGQTERVIRALTLVVQSQSDERTQELVVELINRTRKSVVDPAQIHVLDQVELVARAGAQSWDAAAYERFLREIIASNDEPSSQLDLVTIAVQALIRVSRVSEAMDLLSKMCINPDGTLDTDRVVTLMTGATQVGSFDDVINAIETLHRAGLIGQVSESLSTALGTRTRYEEVEDDEQLQADVVYSAAVVALFHTRDELAISLYRKVLELDPGHTWAMNDLGYRLVELGRDLQEAERMLDIAHSAEPEAANIADSLAWARYALGILTDEVDESGVVTRMGAKGLLLEALTLEDGTENAVIYDHLGDTLWMLGEFEPAIQAWTDAEMILMERMGELTDFSSDAQTNPNAVESLREDIGVIQLKIQDAQDGRAPAVKPTETGLPVPIRSSSSNNTVSEDGPE